jgi:hypothetical protein
MVFISKKQRELSDAAHELRSAIRDVGSLVKAGHTSGFAWDAANIRQDEALTVFRNALNAISTW